MSNIKELQNRFDTSTLSMLLKEFAEGWKELEPYRELDVKVRALRTEIFRRCDNMDISHEEACAMLDESVFEVM